jgi:predicted PolB exonuclease-like 3'-5' exonuclease
MINTPITKILFIDIETVGAYKDYDTCLVENPSLANQFEKYFDWFLKRFPEDINIVDDKFNQIFKLRTPLIPEFAKIVCVSVAFVTDNDDVKIQSYSDNDELLILKDIQKLLNRCAKLDFFLCGHNIKNFDIPMISKRMVINNLLPPKLLPSYDTKPWDIKAIDTKEIWQFGSFNSIASLDLLCNSLNINSSKDGVITGDKVHTSYWEFNKLNDITEYCENDVKSLIEIIRKLKQLS